jgi:hypothetical protein
LRDICEPGRFWRAITVLAKHAGGKINRTVRMRAEALIRLASHPGVLNASELKQVRAVFGKVLKKHSRYLETCDDRDQRMLDQLDDPSVMDAFLALPTITKNRVLSSRKKHTLANAYAIQRVLILELWMCAPYRLGHYACVELEQLVAMRLDSVERTLLRGPKDQPRNKKSPEHFLNEATIELLRLYLAEFRPIILAALKTACSPYLLPGRNGRPKAARSLHHQIICFVRKNTSLKAFHPHFIRKIVPKITLDADPGAVEVARRTGGWADDKMLRSTYGQRVHRASQNHYLQLLESRRLNSVRTFPAVRRRKNGGGK